VKMQMLCHADESANLPKCEVSHAVSIEWSQKFKKFEPE
jgi:hypothetical protein